MFLLVYRIQFKAQCGPAGHVLCSLHSHSVGVMQGTGWVITQQAYQGAAYLNGVPLELLEFVEWGCVIGNACLADAHSQRGRVWEAPGYAENPLSSCCLEQEASAKLARHHCHFLLLGT